MKFKLERPVGLEDWYVNKTSHTEGWICGSELDRMLAIPRSVKEIEVTLYKQSKGAEGAWHEVELTYKGRVCYYPIRACTREHVRPNGETVKVWSIILFKPTSDITRKIGRWMGDSKTFYATVSYTT